MLEIKINCREVPDTNELNAQGVRHSSLAQNYVSVRTCGFESRLRRSQMNLYVPIIPLINAVHPAKKGQNLL